VWVTHPCQTCEGHPAPPAHPSHRTRTGSDLPPELSKDGEEGRGTKTGACTNHTRETRQQLGIRESIWVYMDPQNHPRKQPLTAQSSCNSCVINREQAEGAVGMALITRTPQCPSQNPICEKSTKATSHKSRTSAVSASSHRDVAGRLHASPLHGLCNKDSST
jgi:hypothetical protein